MAIHTILSAVRLLFFPPRPAYCRALPLLLAASLTIAPLAAQADLATFDVKIGPDNNVIESPPSGNNGVNPDGQGPWYQYSNGWNNQWYFNGGNINGWKYITWDFSAMAMEGTTSQQFESPDVEIAINWSDRAWSGVAGGGASMPPLPGVGSDQSDGFEFIERVVLFNGQLSLNAPTPFNSSDLGNTLPDLQNGSFIKDGQLIIPDINPQWVSIDIRVTDNTPGHISAADVAVSGRMIHVHVPEPSAFLYGGVVAAIAGIGYRRRQKQAAA